MPPSGRQNAGAGPGFWNLMEFFCPAAMGGPGAKNGMNGHTPHAARTNTSVPFSMRKKPFMGVSVTPGYAHERKR